MRKSDVTQVLDRIDHLPVAGQDVVDQGGVLLNVAHVGNLVTIQAQPGIDPRDIDRLNAAFEESYYVDSSNLAVGYWSVLAEGAELPE